MMTAQEERIHRNAARAVSRAAVSDERVAELRTGQDAKHLTTRLAACMALLDEAIEAVDRQPSRSHCLSLVLAAGFAWQVIRVLGDQSGKDADWHAPTLPPDHAESDADLGDNRYATEIGIREDAVWLHGLHSKLRHPSDGHADLIGILCDPPPGALIERLSRAARGVRFVLLLTSARIGPVAP